jgi:hypothetical protein
LADSFNSFYATSILRGIDSSYSVNPDVTNNAIKNQLLDGDGYEFVTQNVLNNYYFWQSPFPVTPANCKLKLPFTSVTLDIKDGDRDKNTEEKYVEVSAPGEYYFINVFLAKRFTQTARISFEVCDNIIYKHLNSRAIFSQNTASISRNNDYLNVMNNKSFDESSIKTPGDNIIPPSEVVSGLTTSTKQYIQCFVDPNFLTNENEYWSDKNLIPQNQT